MRFPATARPTPIPAEKVRFVVLPENRAAVMAMRQAAASKRLAASLYLHGLPGTGKSHLVNWLLRRVVRRTPGATARLVPARDLVRLLGDRARAGREFHDCDLLIIEDMQHAPHYADVLIGLLDERHARKRTTVVTAGCGPAELEGRSPRLLSRLSGGLVVGIGPLSLASRVRLARSLCQSHNLDVSDDVVQWLGRIPSGGARAMQGDLHLLRLLQTSTAGTLSLSTVLQANQADTEVPLLDRLAENVARHFGVRQKVLKGRDRHRESLWPRQVGMYLARKLSGLSLERIGGFFGGYDHSTVLHACRKIEDRLSVDVVLERQLAELSALCI